MSGGHASGGDGSGGKGAEAPQGAAEANQSYEPRRAQLGELEECFSVPGLAGLF